MLAAVFTTLLFSLSAIFGRRVSQYLAATRANLGRLGLAAMMLGLWSHVFGFGIHGRAFPVLFLSGSAGFGLGDLAMFAAYRRIGARRTVVLIQCLAAPIGAVAEWLWLGHAPTLAQALYGCVILTGVGLALLPVNTARCNDGLVQAGVWFGILAAAGQAGGAVLSRKAYEVAATAGESFRPILLDGVNAAYQRMLGGIFFTLGFLVFLKALGRLDVFSKRLGAPASRQPVHSLEQHDGGTPALPGGADWRRGMPWLIAHALAGPAAGVTCFQWALMLKPTNIVLPIVATTPLVVLPLAHYFEGDRITPRAVLGSGVAVAGVIGLVLAT